MTKTRLLLVEDDESLGFLMEDNLLAASFDVTWIKHGVEASRLDFRQFDVCIIDVMLPGMDGFSIAQQIRQTNEFVPILFVTARSREEDRLKGFEIGGDDYITKPFSLKELLYRVEVFVRRTQPNIPTQKGSWKTIGSFNFSVEHLLLKTDGSNYPLTQREAELLDMLIQSAGNIVKRKDILEKLWGEDDYFKGRSLDVFISRLRKYLKTDENLEIRNHHGVGFSLLILSDQP